LNTRAPCGRKKRLNATGKNDEALRHRFLPSFRCEKRLQSQALGCCGRTGEKGQERVLRQTETGATALPSPGPRDGRTRLPCTWLPLRSSGSVALWPPMRKRTAMPCHLRRATQPRHTMRQRGALLRGALPCSCFWGRMLDRLPRTWAEAVPPCEQVKRIFGAQAVAKEWAACRFEPDWFLPLSLRSRLRWWEIISRPRKLTSPAPLTDSAGSRSPDFESDESQTAFEGVTGGIRMAGANGV
jgi:hypothetical protein